MQNFNLNIKLNIGRALLYLFSPVKYQSLSPTSLMYSMDNNKNIDNLVNVVTDSSAGTYQIKEALAIAQNSKIQPMIPYRNIKDPMLLNAFDDQWTFILLVDGDAQDDPYNGDMMMNVRRKYRYIYKGIVRGEPPVNNRFSSTPTINMSAVFEITNKTCIEKDNEIYSSTGGYNQLVVDSSNDYIARDTLTHLTSVGESWNLDPSDLLNSDYKDKDVMMNVSMSKLPHSMSDPEHAKRVTSIPTCISSPSVHMANLFDSASKATKTQELTDGLTQPLQNIDLIGDISPQRFSSGLDSKVNEYKQNIRSTFINVRSDAIDNQDLNTNDTLTFSVIMQKHDPKVVVINNEHENLNLYGVDSQHQSVATTYSHFAINLATIICNYNGISDIALIYNSFTDEIKILTCNSIIEVPSEIVKQTVDPVLFRFRTEIFHIIKLNRGDFNIQLSIDIFGTSSCTLNFVDDMHVIKEPLKVPSLLGGYSSSMMVGSQEVAVPNSTSLDNLIHNLSGNYTSDMQKQIGMTTDLDF